MLKSVLTSFAVALVLFTPLATLARSAQDAPPASTNPVKPTPVSQGRAKKLYAQDCSMCHGDNGNGKTDLAKDMQLTLNDWTDPKPLAAMSDQQLFDVIRKGKGEKMPAEEPSRAKDEDVWNIVIYIRAMSKGGATAPAPSGR